MRAQLDAGNIVCLTNIGYSAAGELLNWYETVCKHPALNSRSAHSLNYESVVRLTSYPGLHFPSNAYDVATHAAVELRADKLLCLTGIDVKDLNLPQWLPLDDAEDLIADHVKQ